jgi:hypothetical protein
VTCTPMLMAWMPPPDGITMTEGKALLVEFMGLQASFKQIHEVSIPFQSAVQHIIVG